MFRNVISACGTVLILLVVMVMRARTGLAGNRSAAWLAVVPTTHRERPDLDPVVAGEETQFRGERRVVLAPVAAEVPEAPAVVVGFLHYATEGS